MKKFTRFFALTLILATVAASTPAHAKNTTIAIIDMEEIAEGYIRYKKLTVILESRKLQLQNIVNDEEQEVLALIREIEKMRTNASQEELFEKRQQIDKRDRELREFVIATNQKFRIDLEELQIRSRNEISEIVGVISKRDGLDLVMEKGLAIFSNPSLSITNEVVNMLNEKFPPKKSSSSPLGNMIPSNPGKSSPTAFPTPKKNH
ncbi:MAG: OmpH family outer membrane protein [Candidatus Lindowbacteria bacterium]|nr:OmpH family outer membrane protein [Candidatus Lindowbacteria bacterium]